MTHTPGPWQIGHGERGKYRILSTGLDVVIVASTANNNRERTVEAEANARLIAAAPDLLVAAKALVSSIENETGKPDSWDLEYENGEDADFDPLIKIKLFKALADAIAKAEGSS